MALLMLTLLTVLRHPLVQAVQVQASLILLVGIIGWTVAGFRKGREAQRLSAAGYAAALRQVQALKQTAAPSLGYCSSVESSSSSADGQVEVQLSDAAVRSDALLGSDSGGSLHACKSTCGGHTNESSSSISRAHQLEPHSNSELRFRGQVAAQQQLPKDARGSHDVQLSTDSVISPDSCQTAATASGAVPGNGIFKSRVGQTAGLTSGWPAVAVVCPVKGCRQHSRDNWASQLTAHYGGPLAFIFVVESSRDPAVAALRDLVNQQQPWQPQQHSQQQQQQQQCWLSQAQEQQQPGVASGAVLPTTSDDRLRGVAQQPGHLHELHDQQQQPEWCHQERQQQQCVLDAWSAGDQQVLLVDAGLAATCSQKLHNVLAGIEAALPVLQQQQQQEASAPGTAAAVGDGYVCVLDDDVALHPLSMLQLVDELEHDQSLFVATGFPYDIVTHPDTNNSSSSSSSFWGRLCAHATAAYHLPLCIAFSVADRAGFVWGGVMVMRAHYLRIAAAQLQASGAAAGVGAGRMSSRPMSSRIAGIVDAGGQLAMGRSNILQVWRDGGYSDDLLLSGFCAAHKLSIAVPVSACFPQLLPATCTFKQYWNYLRRQLFVLDTYYSRHNQRLNHTMMALHSYGSALFTGATAATLLQLLLLMMLTADTLLSGRLAGSSSSSRDSSSMSSTPLSLTSFAMWLFTACTVLSLLSIRYMNHQVRQLFWVLSAGEVQQCHVSVIMLWLGWMLDNLVLPYCTVYCCLCDHIVWGGIKYHKKNGRVDRIVHPN